MINTSSHYGSGGGDSPTHFYAPTFHLSRVKLDIDYENLWQY